MVTGVCCNESQFGFAHPYLVQCLSQLRAEVHLCLPAVHTAFAAKVRPVILSDTSCCIAFGTMTNSDRNVERTGAWEERRRPVSGSVPLIACED